MANEFILRKGLISLGGITFPYTGVTSTYSIGVNDYMIDCTTGTFTTTLPTAVGISGKSYSIKNSGAGTITVATTSSQTIDGVTSKTLTQYQTLNVESNGSNWIISVLAGTGSSGGSYLKGSSIFNFTTGETDTVINTISSALITNTNINGILFIPSGTTETSFDDFTLNGVSFNIENIIDNTSFDIRANAANNATGNYTINYSISY